MKQCNCYTSHQEEAGCCDEVLSMQCIHEGCDADGRVRPDQRHWYDADPGHGITSGMVGGIKRVLVCGHAVQCPEVERSFLNTLLS